MSETVRGTGGRDWTGRAGFAVAILLIALGVVFWWRSERTHGASGGPAPDFSLPAVDGSQVSLADLHGRVVVLDFWSLACGPCIAEMPAMAELTRRYQDRGVEVLSINTDGGGPDARQAVAAFAREQHLPMRLLLDSGEVAARYGVEAIPQVYIVARDGREVGAFTGLRPEGDLAGAIDAALE